MAGIKIGKTEGQLLAIDPILIVILNFGIWDLFSNTMRKVEQFIHVQLIAEVSQHKKAKPVVTSPSFSEINSDHLFLNFLLNPARPNRPVPRSRRVAGSGTGAEVVAK
jgi:hypothetical protein